ncbi:hypothetical protein PsYK624_033250 [Phanerochaete sordida]|uniref:Uncharacterized protein n=1 Tax=Phanerochaete sordida TaxID=48140 RepID=A0A9P3G355_9APHY|nr:hypothetical protein PsYK624_033250 [Phanerochaete sordida]
MEDPRLHALDMVGLIGQFVSQALAVVVIECIAFGIYTLLVICAITVIARVRSDLTAKKWVLLAACFAMYANAAGHLGVTLASVFEDDRRSNYIQQMVYQCLANAVVNDACSSLESLPASYYQSAVEITSFQTARSALLSINMLLGDIIVLWRAWVLWPNQRTVQACSSSIILVTTVMLIGTVTMDDGLTFLFFPIAIFLSLFTNIWSTALIVVRAWQHRQQIGAQLHGGSRTRAQTALLLLIESGVLYFLLWVPLAGYAIVDIAELYPGSLAFLPSDPGAHYLKAMMDVVSGALIDVVGMYPTAVILVAEVSHQHTQRMLSLNDITTVALARF